MPTLTEMQANRKRWVEALTDPKTTPISDVPPPDWRNHPEGFEDGYFEDWDSEPDSGGYDDDEAW